MLGIVKGRISVYSHGSSTIRVNWTDALSSLVFASVKSVGTVILLVTVTS